MHSQQTPSQQPTRSLFCVKSFSLILCFWFFFVSSDGLPIPLPYRFNAHSTIIILSDFAQKKRQIRFPLVILLHIEPIIQFILAANRKQMKNHCVNSSRLLRGTQRTQTHRKWILVDNNNKSVRFYRETGIVSSSTSNRTHE